MKYKPITQYTIEELRAMRPWELKLQMILELRERGICDANPQAEFRNTLPLAIQELLDLADEQLGKVQKDPEFTQWCRDHYDEVFPFPHLRAYEKASVYKIEP